MHHGGKFNQVVQQISIRGSAHHVINTSVKTKDFYFRRVHGKLVRVRKAKHKAADVSKKAQPYVHGAGKALDSIDSLTWLPT